jgi:hypothetical protein
MRQTAEFHEAKVVGESKGIGVIETPQARSLAATVKRSQCRFAYKLAGELSPLPAGFKA